ncbi:MAG: hypothetical protein ACYC10_03625 [Allorhizobium sp.]
MLKKEKMKLQVEIMIGLHKITAGTFFTSSTAFPCRGGEQKRYCHEEYGAKLSRIFIGLFFIARQCAGIAGAADFYRKSRDGNQDRIFARL